MSYTPEGSARVEMKWDSAQWRAVADSMRADVASGDQPLGPNRRAVRAFHQLVLTPPVVSGDSASLDGWLCMTREGGAFCTGSVYSLRLERQGGTWKVVSAGVVGAL
jgi:hypothetical protein